MITNSNRAINTTVGPMPLIRCQPISNPMPKSKSTRPRSASSPMVSTFSTGGLGRV